MPEPEPSHKRLHLRIRGRVQGVFYRAAVYERARLLEVAGWIRNRPDGSVEAVAEGPQALLDAFVAFCREGPPLARVTAIDATPEPVEGLQEFEIRY